MRLGLPSTFCRIGCTRVFLLVAFALLSPCAFAQKARLPLVAYVDPFIGSVGDGNVVVGPSSPFGMVKPGPDCSPLANSGYRPDLKVPVSGGGPK